MKARFNYLYKYHLTITNITPLRIGDSDNDKNSIYRNSIGKVEIPGTSIAGVLRRYINSDEIFGGIKDAESKVSITNAVLLNDYVETSRPKIKINPETKVAAKGQLTKVDIIEKDSQFAFDITLIDLDLDSIEKNSKKIEEAISALNCGDITIGAQRTNGYGKFKVDKAEYAKLDMTKEDQRNAWLDGTIKYSVLGLKEIKSKNVKITYEGISRMIFINSGKGKEEKVSSTMHDRYNKAIIPGSSIKGAFRNQISYIIDSMELNDKNAESIFGSDSESDSKIAGNMIFNDVEIKGEKKEAVRIRINKLTGSVLNSEKLGATISEESAGGKIKGEIEYIGENKDYAIGLLIYAFKDLANKKFNLAGNASIGRGYVENLKVTIFDEKEVKIQFNEEGLPLFDDNDSKEIVRHYLEEVK